jgi:hypothetical protein
METVMKTTIRNAVFGLAVAATALSVIPAEAGNRRHRDDAIAAGIAGLAVGAIVGGLASQPSRAERVYIDPPYQPVYPTYRAVPVYEVPRYEYRPAYTYSGLEPWTPSWYRACSNRYRSFDPSSGTFMGYDGRRHFCTFN